MEKQQLLKFGVFGLNADESVLELEGKAVALTPKMFDTLRVLVKNHGRIVEKETLLREVWPDSYVEEGNIAFNIRQLRKLLGDDAQSPSYIETVPKRGYRFIAPVSVVSQHSSDDSETIDAGERGRNRSSIIDLGLVVPIALVVAMIPAFFLLQNDSARNFPVLSSPFSVEKLSTDGNTYHAVLSSDGKDMVYTHRNGSGKQSLWLRNLETSNSIQIVPPSDHFYSGMKLSPDGETVYFARGSGAQTDIYRMPVRGGLPEKIIHGTQGWMGLSPDGAQISFVRCTYSDEDYCSLYMADTADGENEKKLVTRPKFIRIADNQISPDGKKVAFAAGQSRTASNEFGLFEVDIDTGSERPLTNERFFNIGYLAYLPDQTGILLTAMQRPDHSYPIWQVSFADGKAQRLTTDSECYSRLTLDKNARLLLSTRVTPSFRLYVQDLQKPGSPPIGFADAITASFAPDGKLVFSSQMSGNAEIWISNADGTDQRQITNNTSSDVAPIASPDGKSIYFGSDRNGVIHVWRMNIDGTDARQLTAEDGGYPVATSPDGKWVFYRSGLNATIRKVEAATQEEVLVAADLGRNMSVSPDASMIAFIKPEKGRVSLQVYSIGEARVIRTFASTPPQTNVVQLAWEKDSSRIAYILTDNKRENGRLFFQDLAGGSPVEVADLRGDSFAEMPALALSGDGRSFAVIKGNWKHDAVLIKGLK